MAKRKCIVCGAEYDYCRRCSQDKAKETWRNLYDTVDCMKLFNVCSAFKNNKMSKEDALEELKDIKVPEKLNAEYKEILDSINGSSKKEKKKINSEEL